MRKGAKGWLHPSGAQRYVLAAGELPSTRPAEQMPSAGFFSKTELQELFDERAAILEFDAGYERQLAEQMAHSEVRAPVRDPKKGPYFYSP